MHAGGLYNGSSVLVVCLFVAFMLVVGLLVVCWSSVMLVGGLPVGLSVGGMRMYVGFSAGGLYIGMFVDCQYIGLFVNGQSVDLSVYCLYVGLSVACLYVGLFVCWWCLLVCLLLVGLSVGMHV